ncbi:ricin B-like lectin [Irpex rosettiformis]|uniref:Ricin B-like lectin n=1 Tax=Irpex rosettiformis TaxID=378272 RepID=A0ACB8UDC8_9APHY|nr:ricin B-like lectin [Irpex rosettiformis]
MPPQSGVYRIQNLSSGTVLDLTDGSSTDGTRIQGFAERELTDVWVPAQLWVVALVSGTNIYTIQNACSRTYVDISGGSFNDGTPLVGFEGTSKSEQRWALIPSSTHSGYYVIQNQASKTYIDLENGNPANGTKVQIWSGSGASTNDNNQLWKFINV